MRHAPYLAFASGANRTDCSGVEMVDSITDNNQYLLNTSIHSRDILPWVLRRNDVGDRTLIGVTSPIDKLVECCNSLVSISREMWADQL